jgi:hypothetical protein
VRKVAANYRDKTNYNSWQIQASSRYCLHDNCYAQGHEKNTSCRKLGSEKQMLKKRNMSNVSICPHVWINRFLHIWHHEVDLK